MNKLLKLSAVPGLTLGITLVIGCNTDGKKDKSLEPSTQASGFSLNADICGTHVSIGEMAEKSGGRRQISLSVAMEICGKMENTDDKKWRALGMTVQSPDVYVHKAGTAFDATEENKAQVYVEDDNKVVIQRGGKKSTIGKVDVAKAFMKVKLDGGYVAEIAVGDRQYQIGDAKTIPDSEKKIFISEP